MSRCNLAHHSERRFCCAKCGRAFSSLSVFDAHRYSDAVGTRLCRDPGAMCDTKYGLPRFEARETPGADGTPVLVWGKPGTWNPSDAGERGE